MRSDAGVVTHIIGYQSDVTERVERELQLFKLAYHDAATGLPNLARARQLLDHDRTEVSLLTARLDAANRVTELSIDTALAAAGTMLAGLLEVHWTARMDAYSLLIAVKPSAAGAVDGVDRIRAVLETADLPWFSVGLVDRHTLQR